MRTLSTTLIAVAIYVACSIATSFATASRLRDELIERVEHKVLDRERFFFETETSDFLPNWMGKLSSLIGNDTLLDISVPGTHDTLTSDLSPRFADNWGEEFPSWVNWLLGTFGDIPLVGDFVRLQAKTQGALITQQLDAGVRFLDFRTLRSRPGPDWYGVHVIESNAKAIDYLGQVKTWLDQHPSEVLVIWVSKHGDQCAKGTAQWPGVTPAQKQSFWAEIKQLFGTMLVDSRTSPLNTTSLSTLVSSGQRVVILAADYAEFTGSDPLALDSCTSLDNQLGANLEDPQRAYNDEVELFAGAAAERAKHKAANMYWLRSLAMSGGPSQIENAAKLRFHAYITSGQKQKIISECSKNYGLPNVTTFCPLTLQEESQANNYYKQLSLEAAHNAEGSNFPNAFYIDAVDVDGTIRTGDQTWGNVNLDVGDKKSLRDSAHGDTRYAYAATMLYGNIKRHCPKEVKDSQDCAAAKSILDALRSKYPVARWEDKDNGRLVAFPEI